MQHFLNEDVMWWQCVKFWFPFCAAYLSLQSVDRQARSNILSIKRTIEKYNGKLNITKLVETIMQSSLVMQSKYFGIIGTTHMQRRDLHVYTFLFAACNVPSSGFFSCVEWSGYAISTSHYAFIVSVGNVVCWARKKLVSWVNCLDGVTKRSISALQTCLPHGPRGYPYVSNGLLRLLSCRLWVWTHISISGNFKYILRLLIINHHNMVYFYCSSST